MNYYQNQEKECLNLFTTKFDSVLLDVNPTAEFCSHDVEFFTKYQPEILNIAEIKERSNAFQLETFSGSTIIELIKYNHFSELYKKNNRTGLWYIVFFQTGCIVFDLKKRIAENNQTIKSGLFSKNYTAGYKVNKDIIFLTYNDEIYNDKYFFYTKNLVIPDDMFKVDANTQDQEYMKYYNSFYSRSGIYEIL